MLDSTEPRTPLLDHPTPGHSTTGQPSLADPIPPVALKYVAVGLEFDDRLIETIEAKRLPADWTGEPPPPSTMEIGDRWVKEGRSAVLLLPGAMIPSESNYLLNPSHRDFQKITIRKPVAFSFDSRLL